MIRTHHPGVGAFCALALCTLASAVAQTSAPPPMTTEFPAHAEPVDPAVLRERLAGKVIRMQFAGGASVRLDIRANGYMHADASTGWRDSGRWRIEGSTWCDDWNRGQTAGGCSEVRLSDGVLLLKRRSNGEIVALRE